MRSTTVKWTMLGIIAGLVIIVVYGVAHKRTRTFRAMERASEFLHARHTEGELQAMYGAPKQSYSSWRSVPDKFQRGMVDTADCEYHLYTKEGLPYWYFVAAIDRTTRTIKHGIATNY